jgi:NAD-dependent dihydropyrimidine dehydrogenase PreA subunit
LTWTRRFLRESGFGLRALHGYIYGRWPRQYVKALLWLGRHAVPSPVGQWVADRYHGKVLAHDHALAIVALDHDVAARGQEQIIPYPVARDIILKSPPDVVVFDCPCRHSRPVHCEPTKVCMIIGQPVTGLVLEQQPSARRLTQAEALELLEAEHARGHIHTAWFKDAMLNRFYAICNCCKCCCAGIQAMVEFGVPVLVSSGYVARIDPELCANCGDCVEACAFHALSEADGAVTQDWERCMGCGVCEVACSTGAIKLVRDERKGTPLDVRSLCPGGRLESPTPTMLKAK